MLKIKEFAKLCGTSTFTLRYYDEHEVLCPHETDPATGYRYYHPDQQKDMETILTLKGLGFEDKSLLKTIADSCVINQGGYKVLTHEEILEILEECWE